MTQVIDDCEKRCEDDLKVETSSNELINMIDSSDSNVNIKMNPSIEVKKEVDVVQMVKKAKSTNLLDLL